VSDLNAESRVQLNSAALRWREVGGVIVVMDVEASNYFAVEGSISSVWPLFVEGAVIAKMASIVSEEFDAPLATVTEDLIQFATQLLERGALKVLVD
jgi:Coenzyme PQQ synthesis protein D (PqqD)